MTELFLEYQNDRGEQKREAVVGENCFVGRHSESDIAIPDGRLSRKHLKIDRFGDIYIASDAGSSNGTLLNGVPLREPAALKNGDVLELGGFKVNVVLDGADAALEPPPAESDETSAAVETGPGSIASVGSPPAAANSGSMLVWILVPVFGIVFIFFAGAIVFLVMSGSKTTAAKDPIDKPYSEEAFEGSEDDPPSKKSNSGENTNSASGPSNSSTNSDGGPASNANPPPKLTETAKIEQNGAAFLRKIAHNDPRAFLTTEQAGKLNPKIKQLSGSSAIADNLKSAAKNSSHIKALAESKNLKPQFLAIAAVSKLGSSRGDVLQTAQGMIDVLDKLTIQLGNELADDSLLVIAAYGQGAAGDTMKLRNLLQQLANKSPESSRAIRTIWFLQKNGNITQAEYENALNFLAVGTIAQNPKDFGVSAEPLSI